MNVIGIICEYNPFHNGHIYHINKIKEMFPDSLIILVLNGYFLERGEISIISKKNKTLLALNHDIDLVIELPFVFGTQSADIFANVSIKILENLKCEYLIFGSECNDLNTLNKLVEIITNNKNYDSEVKKYLDTGLNYPTALAKATNINFDFKSNDLLAISYLKTIKLNNYKIKPLTIKRTNDYLDITSNNNIISATNIRNKLINNKSIKKYVPSTTLEYLNDISLNDYFNILKYKIITDNHLSDYLDVDEGIENRLKKVINTCNNIDDLIEKVKSKRYTYNKIRRMIIHILIGFTKKDNKNIKFDYLKILGFNKKGKNYLNNIKKDLDIPINVNKKSLIYQYELKSALLYDFINNSDNYEFEIKNKPLYF